MHPALRDRVPGWLQRSLNHGALIVVLSLTPLLAGALSAQVGPPPEPLPLSLRAALERALEASEEVRIAEGELRSARGQKTAARGERLPLINASYYYTRTLESQFSQMGRDSRPEPDSTLLPLPCGEFRPDTTLSIEERLRLLEEALGCLPSTPGFDFDIGEIGFGRKHTHGLGLSLYQPIYLGGQIRAQNQIADAALRNAELEVTAQNAQLVVSITTAYYDALLSARLLTIAEEALEQAEEVLQFTELAFQVGEQPEYDVLRARVARDLQRNNVIQRRSARDLAFFDLKQRLDIPTEETIVLTTSFSSSPAEVVVLPTWAESAPDTSTELRVGVRQAQELVEIQEAQVQIARAQGRPTVALTSDYGLIAYPENLLPLPSDFRRNWTIGVQVSYPLFTGGRIRGAITEARGELESAEARLEQIRKAAAVDTRAKLEALETARAALDATTGTVEEARRAYELAQLRYEEDLANLTEVSDARLALSQAEIDRAEALRNLYIAEIELLLIQDLPIGGGAITTVGGMPTPAPERPAQGMPTTPRSGIPGTGTGPTTPVPGMTTPGSPPGTRRPPGQ